MTKLTWIVFAHLVVFVTSFRYNVMIPNPLKCPTIAYNFEHYTHYRKSLKSSIGIKSIQHSNVLRTGSKLFSLVNNNDDDIKGSLYWTVSCAWWAQVVALISYAAALIIEETQLSIHRTISFRTLVSGINISTCLLALLSAWSMSRSFTTSTLAPQQQSAGYRYRLLRKSAQFSIEISIIGMVSAIAGMETVLGPLCGQILSAMMLQWSAPSTALATAASSIPIDALAILHIQSYLTGIFAHCASLLNLYLLMPKLSQLSIQRAHQQPETATTEDFTETAAAISED